MVRLYTGHMGLRLCRLDGPYRTIFGINPGIPTPMQSGILWNMGATGFEGYYGLHIDFSYSYRKLPVSVHMIGGLVWVIY